MNQFYDLNKEDIEQTARSYNESQKSLYFANSGFYAHFSDTTDTAQLEAVSFFESNFTQNKNQEIYEEWRATKDSIEQCSQIFQKVFDISEIQTELEKMSTPLVLNESDLFPKEINLVVFDMKVLVLSKNEIFKQGKKEVLQIEKLEYFDIDIDGYVEKNCALKLKSQTDSFNAEVNLKWDGLEWQITNFKIDHR